MTATRQESARGAELLLQGALLMRYCNAGDEESGELDALEVEILAYAWNSS